ncbi:gastric inhibitory polypeptide receptor isoform X4 [Homo sapiens]|uniref:gastric inhibitory polypeptide receptor isoform X4 n=1 Tax=Homo sapiens TaxID=9606 RepID=UPI0005D03A04|nr:gastric inhibitory polypeptide receptor isoform X4 [Homo sapiens]|eukprot:XP_011525015.1 gastric inhibitory polypeptide receptor isoform X3 [Homo sapiens]
MTTSPILQLLLRLSLCGLLLQRAETGSKGQTAGELYQRWERYRRECQETLAAAEPPSGLACNGSFDMYVCWDYAAPNATARASCPWYLPWHHHVAAGFVLRQCGSDGQWGLWRDHTQCENPEKNEAFLALAACRTAQIVTQYCVGANYTWLLVEGVYLHSLLVLVGGSEEGHFRYYLLLGWGAPALFVIPWVIVRYLYENTQCWERNEVKAIWWIIRTPILMTILVGSVPPPPGRPQGFPILGSGLPPPPAPSEWDRGWLSPYLSPQINFLIFIRILGILLSKLRTRQMRCRDYRLRLARSTLTLVPLLGVHEVVFAPVTEEQARGALRFAKLGFEIFLSSFQGFLVSVLYCFINKEVQSEIRRGWHHCRLRRSLGEEQRQLPERAFRALPSGSGPGEVPTSRGLSSGTLPGPGNEASRELESYC